MDMEEAIAAALEAFNAEILSQTQLDNYSGHDAMRRALEAALPYLRGNSDE